MNLSTEQSRALDLSRNILVSAGAGSGKTRVLVERYLSAIEATGFDVDSVLAVTFSKKAAAELLGRIRKEVRERIQHGGPAAPRWREIRNRLSDAWIDTIHGFCARALGALGPAAGIGRGVDIVSGGAAVALSEEAARSVVDSIAATRGDPDSDHLATLLGFWTRKDLVERLGHLIRERARAAPWADAVLRHAGDPHALSNLLPPLGVETGKPPTNTSIEADVQHHVASVSLAALLLRSLAIYREMSRQGGQRDFHDLLETFDAHLADPKNRAIWAPRFRHVLVDEFQDTDPVQWRIFRRLLGEDTLARAGICVVGDEKQSIYGFRGGDVVTFRSADREVVEANARLGLGGGSCPLVENYRSTPGLVAFVNELSSALFPDPSVARDFEARHAEMISKRDEDTLVDSTIEVLLSHGPDVPSARDLEMDVLAGRIRRFIEDRTPIFDVVTKRKIPARFGDVAILIRSRTCLPALEAALITHQIPFRVLGGVGFSDRQEVACLRNLMRFLRDERDDLALLGVLRSPLILLADSVLLAACSNDENRKAPLWRKMIDLDQAVHEGKTRLPTPEDEPVLQDAIRRLRRYRTLADRLPANELLAQAVRESDLLFTLGISDPSGRAVANVELLIDRVARIHQGGEPSLDAIVRALAETADGVGDDAQADPPASADSVSVMTVHNAKGAEWPIVLIADCGSNPLKNTHDEIPVRTGGGDAVAPVLALTKVYGEEKTAYRTRVTAWEKALRTAESKRLFYVAATRARDHLVISGLVKDKAPPKTPKKKDPEEPEKALECWAKWTLDAASSTRRVFAPNSPAGRASFAVLDPAPRQPAPAPTDSAVDFAIPASDAPLGRLPTFGALPISVTATAFSTLRTCARRFFLERVVGAPDDKEQWISRASSDRKIDPRARGSIIHSAMEALADGRDPLLHLGVAASALGVSDESVLADLRAHLTSALDQFRKWPIGARILAAPKDRLLAELPFLYGRGQCQFKGSMDLVFRDPSGKTIVIDYKTDPVSSESDARSLARDHGYLDQMGVYGAAALASFGGEVEVYLFFTGSGTALQAVPPSGDRSASWWRSELDRFLSTLDQDRELAYAMTTDASVCRACPHYASQLCPGAPPAQ